MSFASWGNALYSGRKSYKFIDNRKYLLIAGVALMLISVLAISVLGLERSIDLRAAPSSQFLRWRVEIKLRLKR